MILVTGATGLVGSHLVQALIAEGKPFKALYRSSTPKHLQHPLIHWVNADILDVVALENAMENVSQVYHCAAIVSFNPKHQDAMFKVNVEGTANVVNACINASIQKLVFVSSVAALGRIREGSPINEQMYWTPETSNSEYGRTKYLAELEVWRGMAEGLNVAVVNPVIILGAGDWNKGSSEIFLKAYQEFPWYTDGSSGFVDVVDVVRAMIILMKSDVSGTKFILSAHNLTYHKVFCAIAESFGKKAPSRKVTPFIAGLVWRWEVLKSKLFKTEALLTRETAKTAQAKVSFDNSKFLNQFPGFAYTPFEITIQRVCKELKELHNL